MSMPSLDAATKTEPPRGLSVSSWKFAALLLLVTAVAFANAAHDAFVFDDKFFIPDGTLTLRGALRLFTEDAWSGTATPSDVYRPLLILSILFEGALHGMRARWFHITNIALHVTTTLVLFGLLLELLRGRRLGRFAAFFAALLFGLHPIHTEAVNSIFNRSEIMTTLGVLAAIWVVYRDCTAHPLRAWTLGGVFYFFALLCRESAAPLPLLILIVLAFLRPEVLFPKADSRSAARLKKWRLLWPAVMLVLVAVLYVLLRRTALSTHVESFAPMQLTQQTLTQRIGLVLSMLRQGLRLLFVPYPLRAYYDTMGSGGPLHALIIHVLVLGAALQLRRAVPGFLLGLLFYYIAMLPSTRLLTAGHFSVTLSERYLYLPSVGLAIGIALSLPQLFVSVAPRMAIAILSTIAGLFFVGTGARNADWRSDVTLWEAEARVAPNSGNTWRYLAGAYLESDRPVEAVRVCDEHLRRFTQSAKLQTHCAIAYEQLHRNREAEASYRSAVELRLGSSALANLGRFLANSGRRAEAEQAYQAAIDSETQPARKHYRRALFLLRFYPERTAEATLEFQRALELQPRFAAARAALDDLKANSAPSKTTPLDAR